LGGQAGKAQKRLHPSLAAIKDDRINAVKVSAYAVLFLFLNISTYPKIYANYSKKCVKKV